MVVGIGITVNEHFTYTGYEPRLSSEPWFNVER